MENITFFFFQMGQSAEIILVIPSGVICYSLRWKIAMEIVDLPTSYSYVKLLQSNINVRNNVSNKA